MAAVDAVGNPIHVVSGAPVESAWGNAVADRIVAHFATVAQRDSIWPTGTAPDGAMCITLDYDYVWQNIRGTGWRAINGTYGGTFNQNTDSAGNFSIVGVNRGGTPQSIFVAFDAAIMSFYATRSTPIFPYLGYRMSPNNQNIECSVYFLNTGSPATITRPGVATYTGYWRLTTSG